MTITIKRNTGFTSVASKIQIKLDGEKVGSVMHNKHIEVEIPKDKANLEVTQLGVLGTKSNKIAVKDGDVIEITSTTFSRIINTLIVPLSFIFGFLVRPIPNFKYKLIVFAVFFSLAVISQFLFTMLNIKVVTEKISQNS